MDTPPKLDSAALKSASVNDIQNRLTDKTFATQLKSDPVALDNVQTALNSKIVATPTTTEEKKTNVEAATTLIVVTAKGSEVGTLVENVANSLPTIQEKMKSNDVAGALSSFVAGKTEAQITATLTNLIEMADALAVMQTAATSGTTVDSTTFFGTTTGDAPVTGKAALAQYALLAAAAKAVTADNGSVAATAAALASGTGLTTGTSMTDFTDALKGTSASDKDPTANSFAYVNLVPGALNLTF